MRDVAYQEWYLVTVDPNIVHSFIKKCSKSCYFINKTSSLEFPQNNGFVETAIQTVKKTQQKGREDDSDPYLAMLLPRTIKSSSGTSASELLMKKRAANPSSFTTRKTKLKKATSSQSKELQSLNTADAVRDLQNNNWT